MRVATYNIRNVRAVDRASWWWRRRGRLAAAIEALDADLVGLQEAYAAQIGWLRGRALPAAEWEIVGVGRNPRGGGEAVPLGARRTALRLVDERTRWFGPTPDRAGSRMAGAQFPRIATIAEFDTVAGATRVVAVNLHLDSASPDRRAASLEQLREWLDADHPGRPTIVLGDFNAPLDEPGIAGLLATGLRSALAPGSGPTSNGFGRDATGQQQIDHILVTEHFRVERAAIVTDAGHASDHYPVVADLTLVDGG